LEEEIKRRGSIMVSFGSALECRCKSNNWELEDGDGVEYELWVCQDCKEEARVPIEITRYFEESERKLPTTLGDLKYLGGSDEAILFGKYLLEGDGYYDGSDEDLLPWSFTLEEVTRDDGIIMVMLLHAAWHGTADNVISYAELDANDDKTGYTYIVEYKDGFVYQIEITSNMGLWSIEKIGRCA
tara:strand:- start:1519 stop:2073 length:555 start_codon:yes stop_codon:yes gene_type:complete